MLAKIFTTLALIFALLFQNIAALPVKHGADIRLKAVLMDAAILTVAYLDDVVVWRLSRSDRDPIDSDVKP